MTDATPERLWSSYRPSTIRVSPVPVEDTAEYIRADVAARQLAERDARIAELEAALLAAQGCISETRDELAFMRADGLRKQLDAANKRNVALSGELAFMRDDRNLYYATAKRQTSAIEEFNARIAELEAAQCANSEIVGLIAQWAFTDGSHHRQWLLDQILRVAAGDSYETVVSRLHEWDEGVPP